MTHIITLAEGIVGAKVLDDRDQYQLLVQKINQLIETDFNKLIQLLYRIDIDEMKLKAHLQHSDSLDAANVIADMIIERQIQKIRTRQQFESRKNNVAEDEAW